MCIHEQEEHDNLTIDQIHQKYSWHKPRLFSCRERGVLGLFNDLQSVIGGKAHLEFFDGNYPSFSFNGIVGINLKNNNEYQATVTTVKKIHVDLYVIAHEFGHQAQTIHQLQRYKVATKRSKEANADYFAGFWIGIKLGEKHNIDFKGLSQIAYNLKGAGDGPDNYPYPEQRDSLLLQGCGNAAAQQLCLNTNTITLRQALNADGIAQLWDASDANLRDWESNLIL
jgi:hypothetical protein